VVGGYGRLMQALAARVDIRLASPVTLIQDIDSETVRVTTSEGAITPLLSCPPSPSALPLNGVPLGSRGCAFQVPVCPPAYVFDLLPFGPLIFFPLPLGLSSLWPIDVLPFGTLTFFFLALRFSSLRPFDLLPLWLFYIRAWRLR
jgi:hypothetical protein